MNIKYRQHAPKPPGYRYYSDMVREVEQTEGLKATGWHYGEEPSAEEIEYKSTTHHHGAPLVARHIVGTADSGWTLFQKASLTAEEAIPLVRF